jgi:hypothetical protein
MTDWLVLTASLPTSPSGLRVRIWRALKGIGCATLREGVYILPAAAASAGEFRALEKAIQAGGAEAHLLSLRASDAAQEKSFRTLFDRRAQYADFAQSLKSARRLVKTAAEPALRKRLRELGQQLQTIQAADYFADKASATAAAGLETLRLEVEARLSPGEPKSGHGAVARLDKASFQGKTWATRRRPCADRLATAWLILRLVDTRPCFLWLADTRKCPKTALGFDFDGARFTHTGDLVSFEVVAQAFGLDDDPAIRRLGELVHYVDVGGIPVDEAAGVETVMRGLQARHDDDDALLAAACDVFDALYVALGLAV